MLDDIGADFTADELLHGVALAVEAKRRAGAVDLGLSLRASHLSGDHATGASVGAHLEL